MVRRVHRASLRCISFRRSIRVRPHRHLPLPEEQSEVRPTQACSDTATSDMLSPWQSITGRPQHRSATTTRTLRSLTRETSPPTDRLPRLRARESSENHTSPGAAEIGCHPSQRRAGGERRSGWPCRARGLGRTEDCLTAVQRAARRATCGL